MKKPNSWLWLLAFVFWSVVIALFAWHENRSNYDDVIQFALVEARARFNKDLIIRRWAANHGGVYAPTTKKYPSNPYLKNISEKDIETPSGRKLTLVNPAYLIRQIFELEEAQYGYSGHITSLKPLRPENSPDPWEANTLKSFENGVSSAQTITHDDKGFFLRAMFPLLVGNSCLKCHAEQGYQAGDVRGGISVTVPLEPYLAIYKTNLPKQITYHVGVWLLGVLGLLIFRVKIHGYFSIAEEALNQTIESKKALIKQNYKLEKTQELGKVGGWEFNQIDGKVYLTNEACQIFGVPNNTPITYGTLMHVTHPDDRDNVKQKWAGMLKGEPFEIESRLTIDDQVKWVRVKAELAPDNNVVSHGIIGLIQDFTEIKALQLKAIRAAQLSSAGELSTMVAHEVNNPLSGVIGYAEVLLNRTDADSPDRKLLNRIVIEGERIAKIVKGLLTFSYHSGDRKTAQSVVPIIIDSVALMSHQIEKKGIALDVELPDDLPEIKCNAQQIEQVLLNIIRNAYQALLEESQADNFEKTITIKAEHIKTANQGFLQLRISNNGPNIPHEILSKINEPFFTTKPAGTGTGLGLSISNDIMDIHDGRLEIRSKPGEHTEMILEFPVAVFS